MLVNRCCYKSVPLILAERIVLSLAADIGRFSSFDPFFVSQSKSACLRSVKSVLNKASVRRRGWKRMKYKICAF